MLRFAPCPNGDMSIESLRVAIFNYILSKQLNEDLLVRIEDIDKESIIEGKDKEILELLSLFSIDYKHVVYQSENLKYHHKMGMKLMMQKKAFSCFCSDEKLNELKETAKKENRPYHYDGFCSTLSEETAFNCNAPFVVRIQKPEANISFTDTLKGDFNYKPLEIDSFIILNHDKAPTYNFACAVDDMVYDVSTVIRSEDYLEDTPKQIHVRNSLGYEKDINYVHLPSILNSNSDNETSVQWLISEGFLPSAIANYLVLLGNETSREIFSLEDALEWFDIKNISKSNSKFDIDKLKFINRKHLENMEDMRLSKLLGFADTDIGKLAKIYIEEVSTLKEIKTKVNAIFSVKDGCIGLEEECLLLKKCLQSAPFIDDFNELKKHITTETGLKDNNLSNPLRYLLTGAHNSPDLSKIYPLIKNYIGEIVK